MSAKGILGSALGPLLGAGTLSALLGLSAAGQTATVSTVAGLAGQPGYVDATGTAARFDFPTGVAVDQSSGAIYVADTHNLAIRRVTPSGVVTTFWTDRLSYQWIAVDGSGNVYCSSGSSIRRITPAGSLSVFAASTQFASLSGITVDGAGFVYAADAGTYGGNRIWKISPKGSVTLLAGSGLPGNSDGTGTSASFNTPQGIAVDSLGNVYVADRGNRTIRMVSPGGSVTTLAGSGLVGSADGNGTGASFNGPYGIAVDGSGNVYVVDAYNNNVRKITPSGIVTTIAGQAGSQGSLDGPGNVALFTNPGGAGLDAAGNIFLADTGLGGVSAGGGGNTLRKITIGCTPPAAPTASVSPTTPSPVCVGSPIQLQAFVPQLYSSLPAAVTYTWKWDGPNGWSSTDQNPTISAATSGSAGIYTAYYSVDGGSCWSLPGSTTVAVESVVVSPATLPGGTVGTTYGQSFFATGGTSPYTFSFTGTLPSNLSLTPTGILSGTPTAEGSFNFSILATDSTGCVGSQQYTIVISPNCTISCTASVSPSTGSIGQSLFFNSTATPSNCFGSVGYTWNFGDGAPPSFSSSPTHSYSTPGTYNWSLTASIGTTQCVKTGSVTITNGNQMLTVTNVNNGGTGTVKSADGSINCGSICSYSYGYNTLLTLTATPTSPSTFTAWSGACTGSATTCQVTMNQAQAVTATFGPPTCTAPGNPVGLSIAPKNGVPGAPATGTDTLVLSWQPGAGTTPTGYSYWLNGDTPSTPITGTSAEAGPRKSAGTVTLNVKASACAPVLWSGVATLGPVSLDPPVARFSMPSTGVLGVPVTLTDQSSPQGTSWLWVYADGTPADTNHLQSHAFAALGPQEVALIVSNGSGTSMAKNTINVSGSVVTPPAAENARKFDASGEGRLALAAASIGYGHRSWLQVASRSTETATVYLRFLDEDGLALERRLELGPLSDGKCDLGAYGLKGKFRLEVVSAQPVAAWLLEERVVEEPRAAEKR